MLIDYAFVHFSTSKDRQAFVESLVSDGYEEYVPNRSRHIDCHEMRYRDPLKKQNVSPDFTVWPEKQIGNAEIVYPIEVLNHRGKMKEILAKVGNKGKVLRGFDISSVAGLAELDLVSWIGEHPSIKRFGYDEELVECITMDADGKIQYYISCKSLDDDCCCTDCSGHWRPTNVTEEGTGLWPSAIEDVTRIEPELISIRRDESGKIISLYIK